MVLVCGELQQRLEKMWYRLQRLEQDRHKASISQIDLDEACIKRLEQTVGYLEAQAQRRGEQPIAAGVVCKCPEDFCPAHGQLDRSELRKGRRVRA